MVSKYCRYCKQPQQNVRSDVVGKIADHAHRFRRLLQSRTRAARLRSEDRVEIDRQDVAFDDLHIRSQCRTSCAAAPPARGRVRWRSAAAPAAPAGKSARRVPGRFRAPCSAKYRPALPRCAWQPQSSARKCWPSLGFGCELAARPTTFGTLTLFLSGFRLDRRSRESAQSATSAWQRPNHSLRRRTLARHSGGAASCISPSPPRSVFHFPKPAAWRTWSAPCPERWPPRDIRSASIFPRYRQTKLTDPQTVVRSITIPFDDQYRFCSVVTAGNQSGVRFYFVDYPPFFDREALLRHLGRRLSRQRRALRAVLARRAGGFENSGRAACFSLPRLAVGADSRAAAHAVRRRPGLPRRRHRLHHPQHGIPGPVSAGHSCRCSRCPGTCSPSPRWNSSGR